jgi:spermidine/putrescine transport system permease protein
LSLNSQAAQQADEVSALQMEKGSNPMLRTASTLFFASAAFWAFLFFRWMTFSVFDWEPLAAELALATFPPIAAYVLYGILLGVDLVIGIGLWRDLVWARWLGIGWAAIVFIAGLFYYYLTRDFYGAAILLGVSGILLVLLLKSGPWSLAFPSAFFLLIFFLIPMFIVLVVSLGDRSRLGTVTYPPFDITNLGIYFDDYVRFFGRINGQLIYLRIFWRSVWLATMNTLLCLVFGYPFAYWIARRPQKYRGILIFLVMIPFWTNFLVRTYAWMLILRDSGLINNVWTITLHNLALGMADESSFFAWLAGITENKLPLLFNQPAVFMGLFYGYIPFMILPLYSNLEKVDWSLLEAAADLGANAFHSFIRVLLPLTVPGIVAGSIIVFIPSLGAYVTPDLMGGGQVTLLGNLLQQQFMTVRNWPFGSAIGFIMMAIMLLAIFIYFRISSGSEEAPV